MYTSTLLKKITASWDIALYSLVVVVDFYIPEGCQLHICHCENLKSPLHSCYLKEYSKEELLFLMNYKQDTVMLVRMFFKACCRCVLAMFHRGYAHVFQCFISTLSLCICISFTIISLPVQPLDCIACPV